MVRELHELTSTITLFSVGQIPTVIVPTTALTNRLRAVSAISCHAPSPVGPKVKVTVPS